MAKQWSRDAEPSGRSIEDATPEKNVVGERRLTVRIIVEATGILHGWVVLVWLWESYPQNEFRVCPSFTKNGIADHFEREFDDVQPQSGQVFAFFNNREQEEDLLRHTGDKQ